MPPQPEPNGSQAFRPELPGLAFCIGGAVGTLGGVVGLGGAEFRLPALVGVLKFTAREAVPINLAASFIVLSAAFPVRLATVPLAGVLPYAPAILGMLAGSMSAAWIGAGLVRRLSNRLLGPAILVLLVVLGCTLIAEGLFAQEPVRLVGAGLIPTVVVAAACGIVIGLVSSVLGVAGGELIIPAFILLYGVDAKLAGSMSILVGLPTIAVGLARWFGAGSILRDRPTLRGTLVPLALGSAFGAVLGGALLGLAPAGLLKVGLGLVLIWSAAKIFGHLPPHAEAPDSTTGPPARATKARRP